MPGDRILRNEASGPTDDLCRRILRFAIDEGVPELSFRNRLARENGWSEGYAQRVIDEYLRFVCLAMVSGHVVTPSDQVDQAWHLHLTYTRSYWDRLCGEVLKRPLHHGPTRGGTAESVKYHDQYARTIESYAKLFGQSPPADIWPPAEVRFGSDLSHVRVNTSRHWVIPKIGISKLPIFLKLACGACLLLVFNKTFGGPNQQRLAIGGVEFGEIGEALTRPLKGLATAHKPLFFFEGLLLLMFLILLIPFWIYRTILRKFTAGSDIDAIDFEPRAEAQSFDNFQIARLLGSQRRCVEVALTDLTAHGLCRVSDDNRKIVRNSFLGESSDLLSDAWSGAPEQQSGHFDVDVFNLPPLSKALLGILPIDQRDRLDSLKKNSSFLAAIQTIDNDLLRRGLIPARGLFIRVLQALLQFQIVMFVLFASPVVVMIGILVRTEFQKVWPHAIVLVLLTAFLVRRMSTLWSEVAADRKATRRGQVVAKHIRSQVGEGELARTNYASDVAIGGTASLCTCPQPELRRLYEWFGRKNAVREDAAGGCGGCSIGGFLTEGSGGDGDSGGDGGGCGGCGD